MKTLGTLITLLAMAACSKTSPAPVVTVDRSQKLQTIEAFGGFGPAKVWWDEGPYFDQLWLDRLEELGVTAVRTQIYWDFQGPDRKFDLGPTSSNGKQIDYLRALHAKGVKLIATAWTPPVWMKRDSDNRLAPFCNGQCGGSLDPVHYQDFAHFLVAYVEQMHAAGVDFYAINFSNEPLFKNPFESCVYTEKSYAEVLKVIGAAFAKAGLGTKLFGPEHMGNAGWNAKFFKTLLEDRTAAKFLAFYAVHSYIDGVAPDYASADGWTALFEQANAAGKQLWMTETSDSQHEGWEKAFLMAKQLHVALRFGRISGWVYWYMAGDVMGAPPDYKPSPLYYAFKQYYRYVRPGSVQVASSSNDKEILPTAFASSNGLTLILINNGEREKSTSVRMTGGGVPVFDGYRTSHTENAIALGKIQQGAIKLPPQSITTLYAAEPTISVGVGGGQGTCP